MKQEKALELQKHARDIRIETVRAIGKVGVGHLGGSLSIADILAVLYNYEMNIDPGQPDLPGRDRLILSKGHAGPALYAALALKGYFPVEKLQTLNQMGTDLPSHCDMTKTPGVDMTTGSLGQGLSCAVGMAMAARIVGGNEWIYVIIGDGESQEGQIWEASMSASHYKLENLIVFMDYNNLQLDGTTDEIMSLRDPVERWKSFGFNATEVNGHDVQKIADTIAHMKCLRNGKPTMIVLHTIKGKGVSFIEKPTGSNHNMPISQEQVINAIRELEVVC